MTDTLRFLERGFRNIELPPLSEDDLRDIGDALVARDEAQASLLDEAVVVLDEFNSDCRILIAALHAESFRDAKSIIETMQEKAREALAKLKSLSNGGQK